MAVKWKNTISPYTANCKSAFINGQIPGRKSKPYHVSFFEGSATPSTTTVSSWNDGTTYGEQSPIGILGGWPSSDVPFLFDPFGHPDSSEVSRESEDQLLKRLDKARDNGFNLATFAAELNGTFGMFAQTATRMVKAWNALKRGRVGAAYAALGLPYKSKTRKSGSAKKDASNLWLELSYGWKPLVSDLYAAAHKAASVQFPPKYTVKGRSNRNHKLDIVAVDGSRISVDENVSVETGLTYTVSDEFLAHASSLGLTNPALVAWELVPLSFVFDWILSVGDWLQGFTRFQGLQFVDGYSTRKGDRVYTIVGPDIPPQVLYRGFESEPGVFVTLWDRTIVRTPGSITSRSSGFHRSPMVSFPSNRPPQLNLGTSWQKFVTSVSLVVQRRK